MSELSPKTREALLRVGTSTLTGVLNRRGLRSMFMQDVWPIRHDIPRMVGIAFTMRFIPSREDKDGPRGIAFGISLTRESVLARFGRHEFYLRHTITGGRVGSVRRLL